MVQVWPEEAVPQTRGAGVQLRGVVAGRGFHWEKRIHPTVGGSLEFRVSGGRLLVINELPLEEYLPGVIAGEMSGDCPMEFLKSQTVVARAWVLAHTEKKHTGVPGRPLQRRLLPAVPRHDRPDRAGGGGRAADARAGAARPQETLIDANYSKSCGGIIESP